MPYCGISEKGTLGKKDRELYAPSKTMRERLSERVGHPVHRAWIAGAMHDESGTWSVGLGGLRLTARSLTQLKRKGFHSVLIVWVSLKPNPCGQESTLLIKSLLPPPGRKKP